ncbi:MAG: PQQ-dependent sugar dehydrogenase [Phycisphaerales bacterium]|nr:PQQ-dependent sugar dehydrogenase [Phycisphaerales bacterium]
MTSSVKSLASGVAAQLSECSRSVTATLAVAAGLIAPLAFTTGSSAQTIASTRVIGAGLVRPIYVTHAPNDPTRIFIIEKQGIIRIADINQTTGAYTLRTTPFLNIDPIVTGGTTANSEQGLLGLAFHPNYPTDPRFFVNYTAVAGAGDTNIASYTVSADPNVANASSSDVIMTFDQPQTNHNGGWIGFGPDGFLYIATGDGGNANDAGPGHTEPGGNSQDRTSNRLGKMLRVDVSGDDFPADNVRDYRIPASNPFVSSGNDAEIWAFGLRNPWRPSFDRQTGDLWIADVGQDAFEEINFQPASGPGVAGRNYGWRCYEGNNQFNFDSVCQAAPANSFTFPVLTYGRSLGCSITGGYVYRGCAIPALRGAYFYADFCANTIRTFRLNSSGAVIDQVDRTAQLAPGGGLSITAITSFGEDALGELYICDQTGGEIFKIIPAAGPIVDCNGNGISDATDICRGTAIDCNADGIPDSCVSPLPAISSQPTSVSPCAGDTVNFSITVGGFGTITTQWQFRTSPAGSYASLGNGVIPGVGTVSGATTTALSIASLDPAANGIEVRAVSTNSCGATPSSPAAITFGACTTRCNAADIANDDGSPLPPIGVQGTNNGVTEGDYNLFFATFFDAGASCDIANDDSSPLPPFGTLQTNNGVTEGDYNLFFAIYFDGCAL